MKKKTTPKETIAQEALRLLSPIPSGQWLTDRFTDNVGKCCAIGHYTRLKSKNPEIYSSFNCADKFEPSNLREVSHKFLKLVHKIKVKSNIATVNNHTGVNGYNQKTPKARVIKMLTDMVEAGY